MTKTKSKGSKFLSGALLGAALGVAVGLFANTKSGKKVVKEVKDTSADFYKYLAPRLKKAKEIGESEYKNFVDTALVAYNKNKKFNKSDLEKLKKEAYASWKQIKKHF